jgi:hypothetical protein
MALHTQAVGLVLREFEIRLSRVATHDAGCVLEIRQPRDRRSENGITRNAGWSACSAMRAHRQYDPAHCEWVGSVPAIFNGSTGRDSATTSGGRRHSRSVHGQGPMRVWFDCTSP